MNKLYRWMDNHTPCTITRKPWHWLWSLPAIWLINLNLFISEFWQEYNHARQAFLQKAEPSMPSFVELQATAVDRSWFIGVALGAVALGAWMYYSHYQNSQSVYLMRRLPDKWEYHRRCLTLPLCLLVGDVIAYASLYGVCAWVYARFVVGVYL